MIYSIVVDLTPLFLFRFLSKTTGPKKPAFAPSKCKRASIFNNCLVLTATKGLEMTETLIVKVLMVLFKQPPALNSNPCVLVTV